MLVANSVCRKRYGIRKHRTGGRVVSNRSQTHTPEKSSYQWPVGNPPRSSSLVLQQSSRAPIHTVDPHASFQETLPKIRRDSPQKLRSIPPPGSGDTCSDSSSDNMWQIHPGSAKDAAVSTEEQNPLKRIRNGHRQSGDDDMEEAPVVSILRVGNEFRIGRVSFETTDDAALILKIALVSSFMCFTLMFLYTLMMSSTLALFRYSIRNLFLVNYKTVVCLLLLTWFFSYNILSHLVSLNNGPVTQMEPCFRTIRHQPPISCVRVCLFPGGRDACIAVPEPLFSAVDDEEKDGNSEESAPRSAMELDRHATIDISVR